MWVFCRATGLSRSLIQHRLPLGISLLQLQILYRLQVDIRSTMDLHGLRGHSPAPRVVGESLFQHLEPLLHSFFINICVFRAVALTYPHPGCSCTAAFLPSNVMSEVPPSSLMSLALASLESTALVPSDMGEASGTSSQNLPLNPPLQNPCYANPIHSNFAKPLLYTSLPRLENVGNFLKSPNIKECVSGYFLSIIRAEYQRSRHFLGFY